MPIKISRTRERIKNLILFHTGDKFDSGKPDDVVLAEKLAANATIALSEYTEQEAGKEPNADKKAALTTLKTELAEDASWWDPTPEDLDPLG